MKITITTMGTRGDVQPYVALGLRLQSNGHTIQIGTDPVFKDFIEELGLGFIPIEIDPRRAVEEADPDLAKKPIKFLRWVKNQFERSAFESNRAALDACHDSDVLLFSSLAFMTPHIAQALNLPSLACYLQPATPSRQIPAMLGPFLPENFPLRGAINWYGTHLNTQIFFRMIYKTVNQLRIELFDLEPLPWRVYANMDLSDVPIVYGFSPQVQPRPTDWQDYHHVTGFWLMDEDTSWQPTAALTDFLAAGPPPVYLGFGSAVDKESDALTQLMIKAVELSGQRAILQGGWSGLGDTTLPDHIFKVDNLPHSWLFPRMAAVVHHGGMGTTATGMRSGVPSVLVPFFADQPFWGYYVERLGVGPTPILRIKLTAENLAAAITTAVTDNNIRQQAAALGEKLRAEDGVGLAVQVIEIYLEQPKKLISTQERLLKIGKK